MTPMAASKSCLAETAVNWLIQPPVYAVAYLVTLDQTVKRSVLVEPMAWIAVTSVTAMPMDMIMQNAIMLKDAKFPITLL